MRVTTGHFIARPVLPGIALALFVCAATAPAATVSLPDQIAPPLSACACR